jgi:RNA polymerase sigma-70 factor (ECF subfamily)
MGLAMNDPRIPSADAPSQSRDTPHLSRISTQWELLIQARGGAAEAVPDAQRGLMKRYCGAVYRYLVAVARDPDVAADLSQEFALRFLRGDFRRVDPERGRFRDYVKTVLLHLVADYHRQRQSEPGSLQSGSLFHPASEPPDEAADREFIAQWRQELLDRAWESLAAIENQSDQKFYTVLRWRAEHPDAPAAEIAERLARETGRPITEVGIRQTLHRAREKFAELLLDEVARSIDSSAPDRLEEELADLGLLAYCQPAIDRRRREA